MSNAGIGRNFCLQRICRIGIQSPPKESIHFCRAEYSKLRGGARWKVGGAPNQPLSWSKLGQASFWNQRNSCIPTKTVRRPSFVLVSPSLGISKWGLVHFGPTPLGVWPTPYFSCTHPGLWVLGFAASGYFLLVETVFVSRFASCYMLNILKGCLCSLWADMGRSWGVKKLKPKPSQYEAPINRFNKSFQIPILYTRLSSSLYSFAAIILLLVPI